MGQDLEGEYREGESLYLYAFENNIRKNLKRNEEGFEDQVDRGELLFYDHSEQDARKQFRRFFGFNAGELLRREPW